MCWCEDRSVFSHSSIPLPVSESDARVKKFPTDRMKMGQKTIAIIFDEERSDEWIMVCFAFNWSANRVRVCERIVRTISRQI